MKTIRCIFKLADCPANFIKQFISVRLRQLVGISRKFATLGHKIFKGQSHSKTKYCKISTSRGISCKPLVGLGISSNLQLLCSSGRRWTH